MNEDKQRFATTTEHILYLHNLGIDSYDIVVAIHDHWSMALVRASVMVDYELGKLKKENDDDAN